ncbi:MAG: RNA methyltransferase [Pseudomonadota bacterium]|nr:RNA methyltransferase [Pseudomonadota bacterium]
MSPLDRLRHDGVLTLTDLAADIAGEPVRGTWWSHPAGKAIYAAGEALDASDEALATKLVEGRVTWVHRALWPFLARIVGDPGWRAATIATLDPAARALLAQIEATGEVRSPPKKARDALERRLLCDAESVHEGRHVMVLRPWRSTEARLGAPADCSLDEALRRVREACGGRACLD